jgi:hypothetical protein
VKNRSLNARASSRAAKVPGKTGQYLRVLNAASEKGLSLETCGREWLRVMFRSVRIARQLLEQAKAEAGL